LGTNPYDFWRILSLSFTGMAIPCVTMETIWLFVLVLAYKDILPLALLAISVIPLIFNFCLIFIAYSILVSPKRLLKCFKCYLILFWIFGLLTSALCIVFGMTKFAKDGAVAALNGAFWMLG
jgi:hypothetical protein